MPARIHACMHACIQAYVSALGGGERHTCIHFYVYAHMHARMHVSIHMHTDVRACMHTCMHAYIRAYTQLLLVSEITPANRAAERVFADVVFLIAAAIQVWVGERACVHGHRICAHMRTRVCMHVPHACVCACRIQTFAHESNDHAARACMHARTQLRVHSDMF